MVVFEGETIIRSLANAWRGGAMIEIQGAQEWRRNSCSQREMSGSSFQGAAVKIANRLQLTDLDSEFTR